MKTFLSRIVGNQFRNAIEQHVFNQLEVGTSELYLTPDPTNQYDPTAIMVHTEVNRHIGFLPRVSRDPQSEEIFQLLTNNTPYTIQYLGEGELSIDFEVPDENEPTSDQ